jgi:outer membrane protein assembly factor BamA
LIYELWGLATVRDFPIKPGNTSVATEELNIGTMGPTLEIDLRDHPFTPTRGSFSRLNIEYGSPVLGSTDTIEYLRSFASFTHYFPVSQSGWVWANSFRAGYLKNLSDKVWGERTCNPTDLTCNVVGVPYNKKGLILGGQSTLRGFTISDAFPNVLDGINDEYLLKTEAQSYLVKSEIRFPIPYISSLGGAVFYDGGMVLIQGVDIKDPYRDCLGIALRLTTPVGAVSLDYAFKLDPRKGDAVLGRGDESKTAFHFSIGTF